MITCRLAGGLGNYMFQIGAAATLANKMGTEFVVDISDQIVAHKSWNNYQDNLFRNIRFGRPHYNTVWREKSFSYEELPLINNMKLEGHFQSEKYLDRDLIFDLFSVKLLVTEEMERDLGIDKDTVSIHVRRGDYVALQNHHPLCTIEYYQQAMDILGTDKKYYVFSDDSKWCSEHFKGCFVVEPTHDWLDMLLMSRCKHNIIANSTFSWWGAWLNKNEDRKVVAPKQWFGPAKGNMDVSDLFPKDWIII